MTQSTSQNTWKSESGYIFSMLGSAIGFANILSFSAQCYRNGGGAFLIPFLLAFVVLGFPMLVLEAYIGKHFALPLLGASRKAGGKGAVFFACLALVSCATIGSLYVVLTAYSAFYTLISLGSLPEDPLSYFTHDFLHNTGDLNNWGSFSWPVFFSILFVIIFAWRVLALDIRQGLEKICSFFLPLLFFMILAFTLSVCFLPGAFDGFYHYLRPDFSALKNPVLWRDVFGHLFFSFSLGLGIVVGYSRHSGQKINIARSMLWVACGDFIVSFLSGFAIFGAIGYLSHQSGTPFHSLVQSDSPFTIGFLIFPSILKSLGFWAEHILSPLFFFCIFIAGITGVFSIIESIAGNLEVQGKLPRKKAVTYATILLFCSSFLFCFGNAEKIIGALVPMIMGSAMLLQGIVEILFFLFLCKKFSSAKFWTSSLLARYSFFSLRYVSLPLLCLIFFSILPEEIRSHACPEGYLRHLWLLFALLASLVLTFLIKKEPTDA